MKKILLGTFAIMVAATHVFAQSDSLSLKEVVVTGTRNAVPASQLANTVAIINREQLAEQFRPSILPTVMQLVPGLTVTSRGMMGYGVSGGAAGGLAGLCRRPRNDPGRRGGPSFHRRLRGRRHRRHRRKPGGRHSVRNGPEVPG